MKIKDFRKPDDYFVDIEPGTVFAIEENICMAIEPIEDKTLGVLLNAVNLETRELVNYSDTNLVQFVEAELCVK